MENGFAFSSDDEASIKCWQQSCSRLDAAARRVARWEKPEPPSGTFTVKFVGRVGFERHQRRYLGDGTITVLMEKIVAVRTAE